MIRSNGILAARDAAETVALQGLGFLAEDGARLGRFLELTGIGPAELRSQARDPATLVAVMDHLLADESLLMTFAAHVRLDPAHVRAAADVLSEAAIE